ncbi:hypothetical protein BC938DRAFT_481668 [Jimgerdemannia flammicorona]|uniref:Uncharacterized protein n=1 Tax=Jimgerdemannia flammicorona TaxID=994334 RepID=A0A433QFP2_9FUNG|nr:hypothetical protein BC938DRAFT_481668 [Jimgerdemannia flammicorona]
MAGGMYISQSAFCGYLLNLPQHLSPQTMTGKAVVRSCRDLFDANMKLREKTSLNSVIKDAHITTDLLAEISPRHCADEGFSRYSETSWICVYHSKVSVGINSARHEKAKETSFGKGRDREARDSKKASY